MLGKKLLKHIRSSIKRRIMSNMMLCIAIVAIILAITSSVSTYFSTMDTMKQSVSEVATLASDNVESTITIYQSLVSGLAEDALFQNETININEMNKRFSDFLEEHTDFEEVHYADENGITTEGMNISFEDYFSDTKLYLSPYVSNPIVSGNDATFIIAAPVIKDTAFSGLIYVVADAKILSDSVKSITLGEKSISFILNQNGDTIASSNYNDVLSMLNVMDEEKNNPKLKKLAEIHGKMTANMGGVDTYTDTENGSERIIGFSPILIGSSASGDTTRMETWSIAVAADKNEFLSGMYISLIATIAMTLLVVLFAVFMSRKISEELTIPLLACVDRMKLLADGDVTTPVKTFNVDDETGTLAEVTAITIDDLSGFIKDVSGALSEIAKGNLSIKFEKNFPRDFAPIGDDIREIIKQMSGMISNIQGFANTVSNGANQVSSGAQALSHGATEQASAIEQLAATIDDVSLKAVSNAKNAQRAQQDIENVNTVVNTSNEQMSALVSAMKDITTNSEEISKILETIEDIAFQTNILSLNAAIEASKAGVAGRGFTVVAEEIRTLSENCAQATKVTAELIQTTIASVQNGSSLVSAAAKSLDDVVLATQNATININNITQASNEQTESICEITSGVEQISNVVQNNTATAEESAAASADLSHRATQLTELLSAFTVANKKKKKRKSKTKSKNSKKNKSAKTDVTELVEENIDIATENTTESNEYEYEYVYVDENGEVLPDSVDINDITEFENSINAEDTVLEPISDTSIENNTIEENSSADTNVDTIDTNGKIDNLNVIQEVVGTATTDSQIKTITKEKKNFFAGLKSKKSPKSSDSKNTEATAKKAEKKAEAAAKKAKKKAEAAAKKAEKKAEAAIKKAEKKAKAAAKKEAAKAKNDSAKVEKDQTPANENNTSSNQNEK